MSLLDKGSMLTYEKLDTTFIIKSFPFHICKHHKIRLQFVKLASIQVYNIQFRLCGIEITHQHEIRNLKIKGTKNWKATTIYYYSL